MPRKGCLARRRSAPRAQLHGHQPRTHGVLAAIVGLRCSGTLNGRQLCCLRLPRSLPCGAYRLELRFQRPLTRPRLLGGMRGGVQLRLQARHAALELSRSPLYGGAPRRRCGPVHAASRAASRTASRAVSRAVSRGSSRAEAVEFEGGLHLAPRALLLRLAAGAAG